MSTCRKLAVAFLAAATLTVAAHAADPLLGSWKIAEARAAPGPATWGARSAVALKGFLNKPVPSRRRETAGPPMLACKGPKYKLTDYSADMLFQGAFGEMHQKDER